LSSPGKKRPEYLEPVPELGVGRKIQGVRVISLESLIRMKLTSYRLRDQMHLKDLDNAGLLTSDLENSLSDVLRDRLARVRALE
jgi:hypothetical protein